MSNGKVSKAPFYVLCIIELLFGILLVARPISVNATLIIILGIAMIVAGIAQIVGYCCTPKESPTRPSLGVGIAVTLIGAFLTWQTEWVLAALPVFTWLFGIFLFVIGIVKIQALVDAIRDHDKRWILYLIAIILSIACGIFVIINPAISTIYIWIIAGIVLIIDAIVDFVALVCMKAE